jgi:ketosteroid isomerase-like protein
MGQRVTDQATRQAVERLYEAYFAGDVEGMLATMHDEVEVRFLGRGTYRGIDEARAFLTSNTATLRDLDFRIRTLVVDGDAAAAVWDESALTRDGRRYENHGVDVFRVRDGRVTVVHENNDVVHHRSMLGRPGD